MSKRAWLSHTIGTFVAACVILFVSYALWREISYQNHPKSYFVTADLVLAIVTTISSQLLLVTAIKLCPRSKGYRMTVHLLALGIFLDISSVYFGTSGLNLSWTPDWLSGIQSVFLSEWQFSRIILLFVPAMLLWLLFLDYLFLPSRGEAESGPAV